MTIHNVIETIMEVEQTDSSSDEPDPDCDSVLNLVTSPPADDDQPPDQYSQMMTQVQARIDSAQNHKPEPPPPLPSTPGTHG